MEGAILCALNSQNTRTDPGAQNKSSSGLQSPFGQRLTENEFPRPDIFEHHNWKFRHPGLQRFQAEDSGFMSHVHLIKYMIQTWIKKALKDKSMALPLIPAFRSFSDVSADLGTPLVQDQLWKWNQMCSALPGCGRSKTLWCSRAGLVILVLAVPRAVSTILESDINKRILCL